MLVFGLTCAVLCAGAFAVTLVLTRRAVEASGATSGADREKGLYQRFTEDVAAREARGEISADLAREERAEAARAFLKSTAPAVSVARIDPRAVLGLGALIALGSMGVYLITGKPGTPDQGFADRLKHWETLSNTAPELLGDGELAAVLRQYETKRANDPNFWRFMAQADLRAGNYFAAVRDLETLTRLEPNSSDAWTQLGMAEVFAAEGKPTPRARAAFETAVKLEPSHVGARYFLGRIDSEDGRFDEARAIYAGLLRDLSLDDSRRDAVTESVKQLNAAEDADKAVKAQIAGMVGNLEASLEATPDNPDGWARLLRSYAVLGDAKKAEWAQKRVREIYAARPDEAARIIAKSRAPVGSQEVGGR